jgi:hypothetical protein
MLHLKSFNTGKDSEKIHSEKIQIIKLSNTNHHKKNNNKKFNNYFGKLPIASNKRDFCSNINNIINLNGLTKNNKRTKKRNCVFLKRETDTEFSINENLFAKDIKILSKPADSASNSIVLYNNHNGYGYVYKISPNKSTIIEEAQIYKRLKLSEAQNKKQYF